jgi:hypothetical protein
MVKVTFTLDAETVSTLRRSAERLRRPQSAVVRDAIADYAERIGRLSTRERAQMLRVLDALASAPPTRPSRAVDAELRQIRASRRSAARGRDHARR